MTEITFLPGGPVVECATINISRDFIVENLESFSFSLDSVQGDPAVILDADTSNLETVVLITDEEEGILIRGDVTVSACYSFEHILVGNKLGKVLFEALNSLRSITLRHLSISASVFSCSYSLCLFLGPPHPLGC